MTDSPYIPLVDKHRDKLSHELDDALQQCDVLISAKRANDGYAGVVNRLIIEEYSNLPSNGCFVTGYSPEYELGYRRGLSIFLFPEAEKHRLLSAKRNMEDM